MFTHLDTIFLVLASMLVACGLSILIVTTKRWHAEYTFDPQSGIQKFHKQPTPRIGGVAVFAGFWAIAFIATSPLRDIFFALGVSGSIAFLGGLAEDLSKNISSYMRLLATIASGGLFCILTGYSVTSVEIPIIDDALKFYLVSFAFTAFAIGGMANAINMIDGFHGLAAGSTLIMLTAVATAAFSVGDHELTMIAISITALIFGFLLVNFPNGYIFLGDCGAYFLGFLLGTLAVMLPMRNQEISPWISIMILAYPLLESIFSIMRKTIRKNHRPDNPDRLHLHMLVYRNYARRVAKIIGDKTFSNPITSLFMWGGTAPSLIFAILLPYTQEWLLFAFFLQTLLYISTYLHLMKPRFFALSRTQEP